MGAGASVRPLRDRAELERVLSLVLDRIRPIVSSTEYRLVGTAAALVQGVKLPTGDIDILMRKRSDVDQFADALTDFPCLGRPVWLPRARQYFTHFDVNEIDTGASTVEVPTDAATFECIGSGPWEHYVEIEVGNHVVPVVCLELRLTSELVRDRRDRYSELIEHMRHEGADLQMLRRSMRDRDVSNALQQRVLDQLAAIEGSPERVSGEVGDGPVGASSHIDSCAGVRGHRPSDDA